MANSEQPTNRTPQLNVGSTMHSWIPIPTDSDFSLRNLPYGVFSTDSLSQRIGTAIGPYVMDLKVMAQEGIFSSIAFDSTTLESSTLNAYASLDKNVHKAIRQLLVRLLAKDTSLGSALRDNTERKRRVLIPLHDVKMHLPMSIGDYTDFCVVPYHLKNCSEILQLDGAKPTASNLSLPLAYHGRSSSVVVSGTPFRRPKGQVISNNISTLSATQKLDFEVELAAFIGRGNEMGCPIDVNDAENYIFGIVLLNDWSARDIQFSESTPLGPFNGKNFCTSISPWIVTLDALAPFRTTSLRPDKLLSYLDEKEPNSVYNIDIDVSLTAGSNCQVLFNCSTRYVSFSFAQMLAHHSVGGCPMRNGDLIATGTISGPSRRELGCLLEATKNGTEPYEAQEISPSDGCKLVRTFLEDGDLVEFRARADDGSGLGKVGFGICGGGVLPSI